MHYKNYNKDHKTLFIIVPIHTLIHIYIKYRANVKSCHKFAKKLLLCFPAINQHHIIYYLKHIKYKLLHVFNVHVFVIHYCMALLQTYYSL